MKTKREQYLAFTKGIRGFGLIVIAIETITYTFSFLMSGIAKKDIFNVIEGKDVTLGIYSLNILILINVMVPLIINCVKQVNSAFVEKWKTRARYNVKSILLNYVWRESLNPDRETDGAILNYYRNECEDVVNFFLEFYYQVPKIVLSVSILIVMFFINPVFAVVSLFPTALTVFLVKVLGKKIFLYRTNSRKNTKEVTSFLNNFFENTEYFYMIGNKERVISAYERKCRERSKSEIRDRIFDSLLGSISGNSSNMALGIILLIALPFMMNGIFSVGEFVMFGYYYAFLAYLPDAIGNLVKRKKQTTASLERLGFLFQETGCDGSVREKDGYDFSICAGGEPKVFHTPEKGIVILKGEKSSEVLRTLFSVCDRELKDKKCVYVPGEPVLFDESVLENISMGDEIEDVKMNSILEKTALMEDVKNFEDGLFKRCGKKGENLSGGQRKRVGIARGLYRDADVLFLDGVADRVDSATAEFLMEHVLEEFQGLVVMVFENGFSEKLEGMVVEVSNGYGNL